jgi:hypothetical protein
MSKGLKKQAAEMAGRVGLFFGFLTFICGAIFAGAVMQRGIDAVFGWQYHFVSIADFLRVKAPYPKGLALDRSFLWLAAAIGFGTLAGGLNDFETWANKSPEQRRQEREVALEEVDRQHREVAERKAARKAARKPLGGWARLWIVVSILLGVLTYLIAHDAYSRASTIIPYNGNSDHFWATARASHDLSDCLWATAKADYWMGSEYMVTCQNADPWLFAILWAFVPGLVLAIIGLVCRWIYRGFRPPRSVQPAE